MAIKLNWQTMSAVKADLEATWKLEPDSKVTFILLLKNGAEHKKIIRFSDFLKFFWYIYDSTKFHVKGLVVTDSTGKVLYRHRQVSGGREEIPNGGNVHIFERWKKLTDQQKDAYLNICLAQIYDHTESSRNSNG